MVAQRLMCVGTESHLYSKLLGGRTPRLVSWGRFQQCHRDTPGAEACGKGQALEWDFRFAKPPEGASADRAIPVLESADPGGPHRWRRTTACSASATPLCYALKVPGTSWLTDPVFSERASPVQWFRPSAGHVSRPSPRRRCLPHRGDPLP